MKKLVFLVVAAFVCVPAMAEVTLFVDSAPNASGSSDYAPWLEDAYAAAANGTFVNMASGINPDYVGTTCFEIQDEVVYSFGDLGKRLHWIYYIPGETISSLTGRFEISLFNTWDGDVLDFYLDEYGSTWLEPTKWIDYDIEEDGIIDGVIGTAGMAWWGAYGVNTQEALDADIAAWGMADESWTFTAKLDGVEYDITSCRIGTQPIPAPGAVLLAGIGISLVGYLRRKKQL